MAAVDYYYSGFKVIVNVRVALFSQVNKLLQMQAPHIRHPWRG